MSPADVPWWAVPLLAAALSFLGALIGGSISVGRELRKHRSTRAWEHRIEWYREVVAAIGEVRFELAALYGGLRPEGLSAQDQSERVEPMFKRLVHVLSVGDMFVGNGALERYRIHRAAAIEGLAELTEAELATPDGLRRTTQVLAALQVELTGEGRAAMDMIPD